MYGFYELVSDPLLAPTYFLFKPERSNQNRQNPNENCIFICIVTVV